MSASFLTYFVVQAEPKILPLAICDNGATVKHNVMALHSIGKMETYEITWEGYVMFAFIGVFIFAWLTCLCIIIISGHTKLCGEGWGGGGDRDSEGGHGDGDGGDCGGGGD